VLRVADVVFALRDVVEQALPNAWVEGEVVEARKASSGHFYFTLADGPDANGRRSDAVLKCVVFASDRAGVECEVVVGARVRIRGRGSVFAAQSSLQMQVMQVIPAGLGDRAAELAKLRAKLTKEGLFDPARKRALPRSPHVIGLVTSKLGAAFHDVVRVALARSPVRIVLAHCTVQGPDAPRSIVAGMEALARVASLDVLIVARGGGASEDLSAFDDERVVRSIAAFPVPVVSGVGHETDVTLADLAADVRAATPSNAAEIVVPERAVLRAELERTTQQLVARFDNRVQGARLVLERVRARLVERRGLLRTRRDAVRDAEPALARSIRRTIDRDRRQLAAWTERLSRSDPRASLARAKNALARLTPRLTIAMRGRLTETRATHAELSAQATDAMRTSLADARHALAVATARADAMSPLAVLSRGYAIALDARGRAIVRSGDVGVGEVIEVRVERGRLTARVERTSE
jgi:exodeoxyribonuclease VII large subunit